MSEHTPGPWRTVADDGLAPTHIVLVLDPHDGQVAYTGDLLKSWDECEANAHLIARAPEMEAALERIEDLTEGWQRGAGPGIDDFVSAVRALRAIRDEARAVLGEDE